MRATYHAGREGSARHIARDFDVAKAPHIDASRTASNLVAPRNVPADRMRDWELHLYRTHYSAALEARNQRYRAKGHKDRCRTIEQVYTDAKTRPEELILQLGDHANGADAETLRACTIEWINWQGKWSREHGKPIMLLSVAIHLDETSPHVHVRRVWQAKDKDGNWTPNQAAALRSAGVERPHPDKAEGRYNNAKMSYDAMARGKWIEIARAHGLEIETEPVPDRRHMDTADYIRGQNLQLGKDNRRLREEGKQAAAVTQQAWEEANQANDKATQAFQRAAQARKDAEQADIQRAAAQAACDAVRRGLIPNQGVLDQITAQVRPSKLHKGDVILRREDLDKLLASIVTDRDLDTREAALAKREREVESRLREIAQREETLRVNTMQWGRDHIDALRDADRWRALGKIYSPQDVQQITHLVDHALQGHNKSHDEPIR